MSERESEAAKRFNCSVRERAIFESGIKLATVYHQFVGTPVNLNSVKTLEKSIEEAIFVQPYVTETKIEIDKSRFVKGDIYSYLSLTGDMISAEVTIVIDNVTVKAVMRYDNELKYPLMYVSDVEEGA